MVSPAGNFSVCVFRYSVVAYDSAAKLAYSTITHQFNAAVPPREIDHAARVSTSIVTDATWMFPIFILQACLQQSCVNTCSQHCIGIQTDIMLYPDQEMIMLAMTLFS